MAEGLYLTGVCKCGRHFSIYAQMPETIEVSSGGEVFKVKPGEHIVIVCPACGKLVNCGNGSRRRKRR